ncbi:MAG: Dabb family protein [Clostridia bacterium]|nr:Dabb family protein [Clostridia bacterium]
MAIRHTVMMRLQPGIFTKEAEQDYRDTFDALQKALPNDVLSVHVYRNVIDRAQNMTVLIELLLKDASSLPLYLQHPLHQGIGERYNPYVEAIASFDCEVEESC